MSDRGYLQPRGPRQIIGGVSAMPVAVEVGMHLLHTCKVNVEFMHVYNHFVHCIYMILKNLPQH